MEQTKLTQFYPFISNLVKLQESKVWSDYDKEADVLYVSFRKPQQAQDSTMEDNIIYHYDGKELVGLTIVGAQALFAPSEGTNNG